MPYRRRGRCLPRAFGGRRNHGATPSFRGTHSPYRDLGTPWLLTTTVYLGSNQTVKLSPGVIIEAKRWAPFWNDTKPVTEPKPLISTARTGSFNLSIQGAQGATIRMHKQDYMNSKLYPIHNEWRYGLFLSSGSRHISVTDLTITAAGGDGVCIAYAAHDIHLARLVLDDNYRNALTITNGKDLLIEDCTFSNTSGTAPSAGVDIEPDWAWSDLSNITFRRCLFLRNWGAGFSMAPGGIKPWNRTSILVCRSARAHTTTARVRSLSVSRSRISRELVANIHPVPPRVPSPRPAAAHWLLTVHSLIVEHAVENSSAFCTLVSIRACRAHSASQTQPLPTPRCPACSFPRRQRPEPSSWFRMSRSSTPLPISQAIKIGELYRSISYVPSSLPPYLQFVIQTLQVERNLMLDFCYRIWKTGWLNSPVVIQNDSPQLVVEDVED